MPTMSQPPPGLLANEATALGDLVRRPVALVLDEQALGDLVSDERLEVRAVDLGEMLRAERSEHRWPTVAKDPCNAVAFDRWPPP
jgi:hypothetical protein